MREGCCITEKVAAGDKKSQSHHSDCLLIIPSIPSRSVITWKSVDLSITSSVVIDKPSRLYEQKASAVLVIV
jgi:hypothetical protein